MDKGVQLAGYGLERLRPDRDRRGVRDGPRRAGAGDRAPTSRQDCGRHAWSPAIGTTSSTAVDPVARDRGDLPPPRGLAPRGRGLRRLGRDRARAARPFDGGGAGRQHRVQPAQVAADQLRLHRLLTSATGTRCSRAFRLTPEYLRTAHDERGGQLPGLGHPARPAVPGAQALVRDPELRRRGTPGDHPSTRGAGAASSAGWIAADPSFERDGAGAVRAGLLSLPAAGRRREAELDGSTSGCSTAVNASRRVLPHPHAARRAATRSGWWSASAPPSGGTWRRRGG